MAGDSGEMSAVGWPENADGSVDMDRVRREIERMGAAAIAAYKGTSLSDLAKVRFAVQGVPDLQESLVVTYVQQAAPATVIRALEILEAAEDALRELADVTRDHGRPVEMDIAQWLREQLPRVSKVSRRGH